MSAGAVGLFEVRAGNAKLGELSTPDTQPGYVSRTYDVGAHVGGTVDIRFLGHEDGGEPTEWIVDDTALNAK